MIVVLAAVLVGCGATAPPLPDGLVLRAQQLVGMPSPDPGRLPEFSLYGDGTVLRPGPDRGALHTLEAVKATAAQTREFYDRAHGVGLDADQEILNPDVVDGYSQVFVLVSGGHRYVTEADNPDESSDLVAFHETLHVEGRAEPYRPQRIAAVAWGSAPAEGARPWPWGTFDEGGCLILDADQATAVATSVPAHTPWLVGGREVLVVFRPLLPDESTCADLDYGR
ncbi:hypothetical protein GCM10022243_33840 [Saccharothrix violaceirubra]